MAAKPVPYKPLGPELDALVDTHTAIHEAISTHAADHVAKLAERRSALSLKQSAAKLLQSDAHSPSNTDRT